VEFREQLRVLRQVLFSEELFDREFVSLLETLLKEIAIAVDLLDMHGVRCKFRTTTEAARIVIRGLTQGNRHIAGSSCVGLLSSNRTWEANDASPRKNTQSAHCGRQVSWGLSPEFRDLGDRITTCGGGVGMDTGYCRGDDVAP
jgi:hypothetical protein